VKTNPVNGLTSKRRCDALLGEHHFPRYKAGAFFSGHASHQIYQTCFKRRPISLNDFTSKVRCDALTGEHSPRLAVFFCDA
jgi:hypothetical protein